MSWYAENVDASVLACATPTRRPLYTHLLVRNPRNGRTVRVYLNDTGAFADFIPSRWLDCRPAVWGALGFDRSSGVVRVEIPA